jgi:hypothetical protein
MDLGEQIVLLFLFKVFFIDFLIIKNQILQVCNNFDGYKIQFMFKCVVYYNQTIAFDKSNQNS